MHRAAPPGPGPELYPPPGRPTPPGRLLRRRRVRKRPRLRHRYPKIFRGVLAAFAAFFVLVSWSVGHALVGRGGGTVPQRLAEWARDHYLGPAITFGEWLTYSPPKRGGKPSFSLTGPSAGRANAGGAGAGQAEAARAARAQRKKLAAEFGPPPRLKSFAGHPLRGEGIWRVLAQVHGEPAIYGTDVRASNVYTSYVAGVTVMNQKLLRFQLHPGVEDPGAGHWKSQPVIPPGSRRGLLATFNGGFKISVSDGGFYLNGQTRGSLTKGVASVVYYRDGHIAIGTWGRSLHMTRNVVGVRQNLHLIVSHGQVPNAVNTNVETAWGATLGGGYYVWRSGIGITSSGRIIFAYGPALNVRELAELLKRAGAVSAMQLDINPDWMSYMYYLPKHHPADPTPVNLLPDQMQPADRYYSLANRDFTTVYAR